MSNVELEAFIIIMAVLLWLIALLIIAINYTTFKNALETVCFYYDKKSQSSICFIDQMLATYHYVRATALNTEFGSRFGLIWSS